MRSRDRALAQVERWRLGETLWSQHHSKHTLLHSAGKFCVQTPLQPCIKSHLHGTDWFVRRGFGFNGLIGMHAVVEYRLGSLNRVPDHSKLVEREILKNLVCI